MKTEEQVKDIIRQMNGEIIKYKAEAIDNLYKGKEEQAIACLEALKCLRYSLKFLEYILDDSEGKQNE